MNTQAQSNNLTPTQREILVHALDHHAGQILWFPQQIKGGARKKVLDGLSSRALITDVGGDWRVTDAAYKALGRTIPPPKAEPIAHREEVSSESIQPRTLRPGSKQAQVIDMLHSAAGATIAQICLATGWQAHTVRGAFAGALKKKLGLNIVSEKAPGGERVYRIA